MPLKTIFPGCLAMRMPVMGWSAELDTRVAPAAMNGDHAAVRALVKDTADINGPLADGATALLWAVRAGDRETVDLLLRGGAGVNAADRYGLTPLSIACLLQRRRLDGAQAAGDRGPNGADVGGAGESTANS